jgi:hypothetical protein
VETVWFSFNVPERGLAGWLYTQIRPNLGVCSGGAFVYGPGAWAAWEQPYVNFFNYQPLPEPLDLRDMTLRTGVRVKAIEPGMVYEIGYRFRDQEVFLADMVFEGLTPPVPHLHGAPPFTGSSHYDQHGRVTGTITLHGETIDVDCFAVRDRSWGRRPEQYRTDAGRLSYVFGTTGPDEGFLVFCMPPKDDLLSETEHLSTGYLFRDGALRRLASATRRNLRNPRTGGVESITIEGRDADGRELNVQGRAISAFPLGNGGMCVNTLLEFDVDGRRGFGEDQDVWGHYLFSTGPGRAIRDSRI